MYSYAEKNKQEWPGETQQRVVEPAPSVSATGKGDTRPKVAQLIGLAAGMPCHSAYWDLRAKPCPEVIYPKECKCSFCELRRGLADLQKELQ